MGDESFLGYFTTRRRIYHAEAPQYEMGYSSLNYGAAADYRDRDDAKYYLNESRQTAHIHLPCQETAGQLTLSLIEAMPHLCYFKRRSRRRCHSGFYFADDYLPP